MPRYIVKRLLQAVAIVFAISLITFFILNIIPGDPVALMLGDNADAATIAEVRANLGMDKPLTEQYITWITDLLHGDMGTSYFQKKPVTTLLFTAFHYTLRLALVSYVIAVAVGLITGILAAVYRGTVVDYGLMTLAVAGISAPSFWVAIMLQIYIALNFRFIPISGLDSPIAYLLPCIALGSRYAASIARITRTSMLEVLNQDFIRTARAKGLHPARTILVHVFRNALVPIITVVGADLGSLLTGSMLTESVFNINGVGKLLIDSIQKRDLPIVQGCIIYVAFVCVVIYLVVDLLYAVVDPTIRLGGDGV